MKRGRHREPSSRARIKLLCALVLLGGLVLAVVLPESLLPIPAMARAVEQKVCFLAEEDYSTPVNCSLEGWRWLQGNVKAFDALAAFDSTLVRIEAPAGPRLAAMLQVTRNFFRTTEARFVAKTNLSAAQREGPLLFISERVWKRDFASSTNLLGSGLHLLRKDYTVAGIVADGTGFPADCDLWTFLPDEFSPASKYGNQVKLVGHLKEPRLWHTAQSQLLQRAAQMKMLETACRLAPASAYPTLAQMEAQLGASGDELALKD